MRRRAASTNVDLHETTQLTTHRLSARRPQHRAVLVNTGTPNEKPGRHTQAAAAAGGQFRRNSVTPRAASQIHAPARTSAGASMRGSSLLSTRGLVFGLGGARLRASTMGRPRSAIGPETARPALSRGSAR